MLLVLSSSSWLSEMSAFLRPFMRCMHCSCALLNAASAASYPPTSACAAPVCRHKHIAEIGLRMAPILAADYYKRCWSIA